MLYTSYYVEITVIIVFCFLIKILERQGLGLQLSESACLLSIENLGLHPWEVKAMREVMQAHSLCVCTCVCTLWVFLFIIRTMNADNLGFLIKDVFIH